MRIFRWPYEVTGRFAQSLLLWFTQTSGSAFDANCCIVPRVWERQKHIKGLGFVIFCPDLSFILLLSGGQKM